MSTEIIGFTQLAADWGDELAGHVFVDSSAAIGVARRKGCGKMRHVRVGQLWIQEKPECAPESKEPSDRTASDATSGRGPGAEKECGS